MPRSPLFVCHPLFLADGWKGCWAGDFRRKSHTRPGVEVATFLRVRRWKSLEPSPGSSVECPPRRMTVSVQKVFRLARTSSTRFATCQLGRSRQSVGSSAVGLGQPVQPVRTSRSAVPCQGGRYGRAGTRCHRGRGVRIARVGLCLRAHAGCAPQCPRFRPRRSRPASRPALSGDGRNVVRIPERCHCSVPAGGPNRVVVQLLVRRLDPREYIVPVSKVSNVPRRTLPAAAPSASRTPGSPARMTVAGTESGCCGSSSRSRVSMPAKFKSNP